MTNIHSIFNKISQNALTEWKTEFHQNADPMHLASRVSDLRIILGDHAIDTPQAEFWRTVYTASRFAIHRKAKSVRLLEPNKTAAGLVPPDCEMELAGGAARYEIVEALQPDRRRGDEYREDREHGPKARTDEIPTPEQLREILSSVCKIKAKKAAGYERVTGLIVVLNVWSLMEEDRQRRIWTEGTLQAAKAFGEVWVLKGGGSWLTWEHRRPALLRKL